MNLSQNGVTSWVTYLSQNFSINFSQNFSHNLVNCQIRWWICHRIWCQFGWHICHKIWWLKCHKKWWQIQWVTKFGDKYVTISGDKFSESANLVTNFSPNIVINLVITKFGDKFATKYVTKYPGGPICISINIWRWTQNSGFHLSLQQLQMTPQRFWVGRLSSLNSP